MNSPSPALSRATAPPRTQDYGLLAQFTLSLIKAMLQAGYYAADHPEAQKALPRLYGEFRQAIGERSELTYLAAMSGAARAIIIDGYEATPLALDHVMIKGMAELFAPKFLEFFDRRNLLSFSLKTDITAEEFHAFVELMAQPPGAGPAAGEERERLTRGFLDHHILHISTVFNDDIVGRERRLPWRVEMALSRLRRDLRLLPLYQRATPEEIRRIKVQIIEDVIRPMRTPGLLKDFLVNCDLVAADIAVLEATQVEREIVGRLSKEMLVPTARELVKDLEQGGPARGRTPRERQAEEMTRCLGILREIVDRLRAESYTIEDDLLESLLARQVVSLEDLPPELQRVVETRRLVATFLARKDENVEALGRISRDESGRQLASLVHRIFPELLLRGEYQTAAAILHAVNEGLRGPGASEGLEELAGLLHQTTVTGNTIAHLLQALSRQDKEGRNHLVEILAFVGDAAGPGLVDTYATSENRSVRASAFEAIRRIGPKALGPFLDRLPDIEGEWLAIHHILMAVADQKDASLAHPVSRLLQHANEHVRQAALTALFKLQGSAAETHLLRALRDRDAAVRQVAVEHLGRIQSRHRDALQFYAKVLNADDPSAPREDDAVLIQICQALAGFSPSADDARRAETILLAALRPPEQKGLLGRLKKASSRHSEPVRIAICEALAAVGTATAVGLLRLVAEGERSPVAERAAAVAHRIQNRSTVSDSASRSPATRLASPPGSPRSISSPGT